MDENAVELKNLIKNTLIDYVKTEYKQIDTLFDNKYLELYRDAVFDGECLDHLATLTFLLQEKGKKIESLQDFLAVGGVYQKVLVNAYLQGYFSGMKWGHSDRLTEQAESLLEEALNNK